MWHACTSACMVLLALSQAPSHTFAFSRGSDLLYDLEPPAPNFRNARRAFPNASLVSQTFEVLPPVLGPGGTVIGAGRPDPFPEDFPMDPAVVSSNDSCTIRLVDNVFANSFGSPALFDYTPPPCIADANSAATNLTVQTIGRQFDRLSFVFLGDIEILRWSTGQPRRNGVQWTTIKDVSQYMNLWREPQKVIFDLGNLLNENLNGTFNVTWDITFFNAPTEVTLPVADVIIPISSKGYSNNVTEPSISVFNTFETNDTWAIVEDFPRNARKAVVTIQSDGQIDDEYWFGNFPTSTSLAFNKTGFPSGGNTGYREIRLYIDGQLAGIQPPFPIVFSGGINPAFWSPLVGIDLFDEKEAEIDISPFLPVLCDGNSHNLTLRVFGLEDDGLGQETGRFTRFFGGDFGSYWQLTGKIFVWTDEDESLITTGAVPTVDIPEPEITIKQALTTNADGLNETLRYSVSVSRSLTVTGQLDTPNGSIEAVWTQTIQNQHEGDVTALGNSTNLIYQTDLQALSTRNGVTEFSTAESYPLTVYTNVFAWPNATIQTDSTLTRSKSIERAVTPGGSTSNVFPSGLQLYAAINDTADAVANLDNTILQTSQRASGKRLVFPGGGAQNGSYAEAGNQQDMDFLGNTTGAPATELYWRNVTVTSAGYIGGEERVAGRPVEMGRAYFYFP